MKCLICGCEITDENSVSEDIEDLIHEKVDFYGCSCLREEEQVYLETRKVCCDCL